MIQSARNPKPPAKMRRLLLLLVLVVLAPLLLVQAGIYAAWYYGRLVIEENATMNSARVTAVMFEDFVSDVHRQEIAIGEALGGLHPYSNEQARLSRQERPGVSFGSCLALGRCRRHDYRIDRPESHRPEHRRQGLLSEAQEKPPILDDQRHADRQDKWEARLRDCVPS